MKKSSRFPNGWLQSCQTVSGGMNDKLPLPRSTTTRVEASEEAFAQTHVSTRAKDRRRGSGSLHKVGLIAQLRHRLEDQSPAPHPQQAGGVVRVGKHSPCMRTGGTTAVTPTVARAHTSGGETHVSDFALTSFVAVLQRPGDPLDGFRRDFGAEVSVERRRSSSLSGDSWVLFDLQFQQLLQMTCWLSDQGKCCVREFLLQKASPLQLERLNYKVTKSLSTRWC